MLEHILITPMVAAPRIDVQYYAPTLDRTHYGGGGEIIQDFVGQFGDLSDNGGDLLAGLSNESLGCGRKTQCVPLRHRTALVASQDSIGRVIAKQTNIRNLLQNGRAHMVAIDFGQKYRYRSDGSWVQLRVKDPFRVESNWQVVSGTC